MFRRRDIPASPYHTLETLPDDPHLADVELTGYRVRILDSDHGTGAGTRVLLDSTSGDESWGSIGVSENIIEASWEALVDSLEYALPKNGGASG